jgi:hypothetical protein
MIAIEPAAPAAYATADVAFWLLERMAQEGVTPDLQRLHHLLFLAQSEFETVDAGRRLMPACFVQQGDSILEPNLDRLLKGGIVEPWAPQVDPAALTFLEKFWRKHGIIPAVALRHLAVRRAAAARPPAKPAAPPPPDLPDHKTRPRPAAKLSAAAKSFGDLPPLPPGEEVRFTGDGRAVTRWRPKRRVEDLATKS